VRPAAAPKTHLLRTGPLVEVQAVGHGFTTVPVSPAGGADDALVVLTAPRRVGRPGGPHPVVLSDYLTR
jgi:hypothetical protein